MKRFYIAAAILCLFLTSTVLAKHRVLLHGKSGLQIVEKDGTSSGELWVGGIHDIHVLENGNVMVQRNMGEVVEIDRESKEVVWSYNSRTQNGNEGKRLEVHAFQPLPNGNVMIAESGVGRIIEVNRDGKIVKETKLVVDNPHPHRDTRLARQLENGNYLVCHEGDGKIREYDSKSGKVIWEYEVPLFQERAGGHGPDAYGNQAFSALRLKNGNTLIGCGNGHAVLEVTAEKKVVWQIRQKDLEGIVFAWITTLEVLPNGNYVIGNCHAGPGQPLLVELNPKNKKVVWTFDRFEDFGNNVSNSLLLDAAGKSNR
ncbi:MAG: PQQ-like beta-propeller repeat protein [Pirellulales bacterium]|nr:PQQ-like beta-propeller repeat protein [Pirellulales bacterium]